MRGDHDELKIFLEIRLIPSRIDQKLKNKEGKYMLLKGKLGPILRPFDAIVEAILRGHGSDFLGRCRSSRICGKFASIFSSKSPRFSPRWGHDRDTIGSRSGHDRGLIVILGLRRSSSDRVEAIPQQAPRSRLDRAGIAARSDRSWSSSTNRLDHLMELQEIGRSDRDRAVSAVDEDPTLLVSPRGVR